MQAEQPAARDGRRSWRSRPGGARPIWKVKASLPLDAAAPRAARNLAGYLGGHVAPSVVQDVQLVASELVTNSVRHSGAGPDARVELWIGLMDTTVRVEVTDPGRNGAVVPRAPDLEVGGGFGLGLVRTLAECWGLEQSTVDGTRVWAQLPSAATIRDVPATNGRAVAAEPSAEPPEGGP